MPEETKELNLRLPANLYSWLLGSSRHQLANRDTIEKEIIYRLEHSREQGDVQRKFHVTLDAVDGTHPSMRVHLRGNKLFELYFHSADYNPQQVAPTHWVLSIHNHPVKQLAYVRVPGPREALKIIRANLGVQMIQWSVDQSVAGNSLAVRHAVEAQAIITTALDSYERDCVDKRFEGVYTLGHSINF